MAAKFAVPSSSSVVTTVSRIIGGESWCLGRTRFEDLVKVKRVLAELPAVVPGADLHDSRDARGPDARAHGRLHRAHVEAVDDDLVDRVDLRRQPARALPPEGG